MQDITAEKQALRKALLQKRTEIPEKAEKSTAIMHRLKAMSAYKQAENLFCFVSMEGEVETHGLIQSALAEGKKVFVPYCPPKNASMEFYRIHDLRDLKPGNFGVLEPNPQSSVPAKNQQGICIVPGIAFDKGGHRLGYGRGYYDRFLAQSPMVSVGICYEALFFPALPVSCWDKPVQVLLTEARELHFSLESR